jgi:hypothetical protein
MSAWATIQEAIDDVRLAISDGPLDKPVFRKAVQGTKNGNNLIFQTFDSRRVTDFTTATAPFGVYVNDELVKVTSDQPEFGSLALESAPDNPDTVEASYYFQWFNDTQLAQFIKNAMQFYNGTTDVTQAPDVATTCIRSFALAEGYKELSVRWARDNAQKYRMEDAPDNKYGGNPYIPLHNLCLKEAQAARKYIYTRQDQNEEALFASIHDGLPDVAPNR